MMIDKIEFNIWKDKAVVVLKDKQGKTLTTFETKNLHIGEFHQHMSNEYADPAGTLPDTALSIN